MKFNFWNTASSRPPAPFIVGVGRSGTTLLRFMLDAHPELSIPPETGFILLVAPLREQNDALRETFYSKVTQFPAWKDFNLSEEMFYGKLSKITNFTLSEGVRCFYRMYAERFQKQRWGDKTPMHGLHMATIQRILPEAHFIHLIRDGRDVALSMRNLWFAPGKDMEILASHWVETVNGMRMQGRRCRHYLEIRYEELVKNPEKCLATICQFIHLPYADSMAKYYEGALKRMDEIKTRYDKTGRILVTREDRLFALHLLSHPPQVSRVYRWKKEMSEADQSKFESIAGNFLCELGYETSLETD